MTVSPSGADSLETVRARVAATLKDVDEDLKALLSRTWCLGPHHSGPNILCASSSGVTASLFAAPASNTVFLGKKAGELQSLNIFHDVI